MWCISGRVKITSLKKKSVRRYLGRFIIGIVLVTTCAIVIHRKREEAVRMNMEEKQRLRKQLSIVSQQWHQIWNVELEKQRDIEAYCRRPLSAQEREIYRKLLAFAMNTKLDHADRGSVICVLEDHPHVYLLDGLVAIAREVPPDLKNRPWEEYPVRKAVFALSRIADKRAIPILIELAGHPVVFRDAREQLEKLLDLPPDFNWGNPRWDRIEETEERQKIVQALQDWWKKNEQVAKIHWTAARFSH